MLYFGQLSARRTGFLSTVAVIAALVGGVAHAQSLRNAQPPAEFPPASFTANQYVDSRGCVFVRAGIGGATEWVPRVSRDREQLCGFQPTGVSGTTTAAPQPDVPNPLDTQVAGLAPRAPVAAAMPAPVVIATPTPVARAPAPVTVQAPAQAPAPTPRVNLPTTTTNTINPLTGRPANAAPVQAASPSPRVITAPVAQQPRVLTRAVACAGLTGIQPHLVGQRTGQPIDCGGTPAPQVASATPATVQPTAAPRVNRTQACADTSRQYVSVTTGLPVRCGPQTQRIGQGGFAQIRADLALPQRAYSNPLDRAPGSTFMPNIRPTGTATNRAPYSNPLDSAPGSTTFTAGANTQIATCDGGGGLPVRCGPQVQSPSGATRQVTVTRARTSPSGQDLLAAVLNQDPPPYSNPSRSTALPAPTVPQGYARVWDDGRLNTQRGIRTGPQVQSPSGLSNTVRYATTPRAQAVEQPRVSTRVAPQPQTQRSEQLSGHRYVQVGSYATRTEAQAIAQSLRSRGLPMRVGVYTQNGREMRMVLAGPFGSDSQLQNALGTARGAGFAGAFTRR